MSATMLCLCACKSIQVRIISKILVVVELWVWTRILCLTYVWKYQDEKGGEIYRFRLDDLNRKLRLKHDFSKDFLLPTLEMNGFLLFTRKGRALTCLLKCFHFSTSNSRSARCRRRDVSSASRAVRQARVGGNLYSQTGRPFATPTICIRLAFCMGTSSVPGPATGSPRRDISPDQRTPGPRAQTATF